MAKRIDVADLDIYYGDFKAVEGVSLSVEPRSVTAFIGPSGCGKSTVLRSLNRMHEVIPGAHVDGKVLLDGQDIYGLGRRPGQRAAHRSAWSSSGPTRSRRCRSTTTSSPACGSTASADEGRAGRRRREVAARRQPLGRGQGPPQPARLGPVRRPAAAALHRPRHRRRAAGAADGRAVLGARPDLDARDRGPDRGAQGALHDRHRHPQHAAGGPRLRHDRRSSTSPVSASPAAWSRWRRPRRSSPTPTQQATEDYISGRFG